MRYFDRFYSNSMSALGNQYVLTLPDGAVRTGRAFLRINAGGCFPYSLLFSDRIDSTCGAGHFFLAGKVAGDWTIHSLRVAPADGYDPAAVPEERFVPLCFGGRFDNAASVSPKNGEEFFTEPRELCFPEGGTLCVEITFSGSRIPYHPENTVPSFVRNDGGEWVASTEMPLPLMVGAERPVRAKLAFIGDSITQGINTPVGEYLYYAAVASRPFLPDCAVYDTGIGYARGWDAAHNEGWLSRCFPADVVSVCFGANDLGHNHPTAEEMTQILHNIVDSLHAAGCRVLLHTIPPYSYSDSDVFHAVNEEIRHGELSRVADAVYDCVPILSDPDDDMKPVCGNIHPDVAGCRRWGEAIAPILARLVDDAVKNPLK